MAKNRPPLYSYIDKIGSPLETYRSVCEIGEENEFQIPIIRSLVDKLTPKLNTIMFSRYNSDKSSQPNLNQFEYDVDTIIKDEYSSVSGISDFNCMQMFINIAMHNHKLLLYKIIDRRMGRYCTLDELGSRLTIIKATPFVTRYSLDDRPLVDMLPFEIKIFDNTIVGNIPYYEY